MTSDLHCMCTCVYIFMFDDGWEEGQKRRGGGRGKKGRMEERWKEIKEKRRRKGKYLICSEVLKL